MGKDSRDLSVAIFIPARAGSKRIHRKNMQEVGGIPLIGHSIRAAMELRRFSIRSEILVDSEDERTLAYAKWGAPSWGVYPLERPPELARDETTADELAYWEASQRPNADIYIQLMPSCPFIKPSTIRRAIATLGRESIDSVAAVRQEVIYEWDEHGPAYFNADGSIPPSQIKAPIVHEMGLYVSRMAYVLEAKKRANPHSCAPVFLSRIEAIDVNWPEDLQFARVVWAGLQTMKESKR